MLNPSPCIESEPWSDKWPLNFFYNSNSTLVLWRLQFTQHHLNFFFRGVGKYSSSSWCAGRMEFKQYWHNKLNKRSPGAGWEIELAQQPSLTFYFSNRHFCHRSTNKLLRGVLIWYQSNLLQWLELLSAAWSGLYNKQLHLFRFNGSIRCAYSLLSIKNAKNVDFSFFCCGRGGS